MPSNPMIFFYEKRARARVFACLAILFVFLFSAFSPLPQEPEGSILDNILRIVTGFGALAGISAAVAMLVAFLRAFGVVKSDEQAGKATAALNLIAFITLVLFGVFRPDLSLDFLDSTAAKIASIGLFVLGFVLQMIIPAPVLRLAYQARLPVIGAVGERTEARAHFIGSTEPDRSENWTTTPTRPGQK
jgi:hypothetical protein